tara:strand:- start:85 stop:327 length:243 start_codon:yes stop_codon:yes gene_type:complete
MSAYLQVIIMIAIRKDDHSAKVNQLGARESFHGYEVRVVQKKCKRSDKNLAITDDDYYASSGVLKYLGYLLMVSVRSKDL